MEIMEADKANVQLATWGLRAELCIAAHSRFEEEFLTAFRTVHLRDTCACGRALLTRKPVAVEDIFDDAAFAVGPSRSAVLNARIRAILSVPLISSSEALVGIVWMHRETVSRPSDSQLRAMSEMAQSAANAIIAFRAQARFASAGMWQALPRSAVATPGSGD